MAHKIKYLKITCFAIAILTMSCNKQRNLFPEELTGYLQLLDSDVTGIDFNNRIKETENINHFLYSQIY